jgi:hypothetical protein
MASKKPPDKPKRKRGNVREHFLGPALEESLAELRRANEFLEEQQGREITALDDPRVYVLDQYIKQVLEILVRTRSPGLRELVAVTGGPLNALASLTEKSLKEFPDNRLLGVLLERVEEARGLKLRYQVGSAYDRGRAGAALRARGMLK